MRAKKYQNAYETLRGEILNGKYSLENPFPSVVGTSRRFGISRLTAVKVFDKLKADGLVCARSGAGTYVTRAAAFRKIGLIVPGVAYSEFFPPIVSEISRLSQKEGYDLLLGDVALRSPEKRVLAAKKLSHAFTEQGVAGVLYQPLELVENTERVNHEILSVFDKAGIPVVLLDNDFMTSQRRGGLAYDVIGIDNVAAGTLVAEYLVDLGVRRIAFQKRPRCSSSVNERCRGVLSTAQPGPSPLGVSLLVAEPDDVKAVRRHLRRFRPEAFVCGNDAAAVALKQTLESIGERIPDDVLLAGFDDVKFAKIVSPQLTTVRQPCEKIAETAFYRLLARIGNPSLTPVRISLPVELVVRGSTMKDTAQKSKTRITKSRKGRSIGG